MPFSKCIGKKALYNLVFNELSDYEKISFFIFCVYRWLSDDRDSNLDTHKYRNKINDIANKLLSDERFIKSLNHYTGQEIRFFGEIRNQYGEVYSGGSTNTIAYKTISEILCKEFNLKNRNAKVFHDNTTHKNIIDYSQYNG